ncbi:MAG TPA: PDZ domain-containing protein, partial [Desulfobacterales bacterium]|nr:PDZ domain-containing protein [Desulfobacterales bacterium]
FTLPTAQGTLIAGVVRDGPADRAGIKPGDVLVSIEGKAVRDPQGMLESVASLPPGRQAKFKLRRDKSEIDLDILIGRRPPLRRNGKE